jgi:23S rRNA pseudouridine2605 synthase
VTIDGIAYGQIVAKLDRQMNSNAWLTMSIREGKNREIRRIMEHLGHQVSRLIRISYGPFLLGDLGDGEVEEIRPRIIADQLGISLPAGPNDDRPTLTAGKRGQHANHSRKPPRHKINKTRRR